jgi:hypothetical protein
MTLLLASVTAGFVPAAYVFHQAERLSILAWAAGTSPAVDGEWGHALRRRGGASVVPSAGVRRKAPSIARPRIAEPRAPA